MKTLELKHLAPYLPYNTEYYYNGSTHNSASWYGKLGFEMLLGFEYWVKKGYVKPILRPLSDLTKEIEHNGEKFMPMKRLASIATIGSEKEWFINNQGYAEHPTGYTFYIESIFNDLVLTKSSKWKDFDHVSRQWDIYQKLFEWHFWIFDQSYFDKGLIIDINKLNK